MRPRLLRFMLFIIEMTSLPLLIVSLLYLITGYQMLNPYIRIFPAPRTIHSDQFLRIIALTLTAMHSYSGLVLLIARRFRRMFWLCFALLNILIVFLLITIAYIEISFI